MSFIPSSRCPDPEECEDDGQCNGHCAEQNICVNRAVLAARWEIELSVHNMVLDKWSRERFPVTNMLRRVLAKPDKEFTKRNEQKNKMGLT